MDYLFSTFGWLILFLTLPVACAMITSAVLIVLKAKRTAAAVQKDYSDLTDQLSECTDCSKDNIAILKNFSGSHLKPAVEQLLAASQIRFKDDWLTAPEAQLMPPQGLPAEDRHWLSWNIVWRPALIGLISTTVAFFCAVFSQLLVYSYGLVLLPLGFGLLASAVLHTLHLNRQQQLEQAAATCCQTIRLRLPVYDDRYGLALLIEDFQQYDRRMADRVEALDQTVANLADRQFAAAMQTALTDTLKKTISPTITRAEQTLTRLSDRVQTEQNDGMKQLAEQFTATLKTVIEDKWAPLYQAADRLTANLAAGSERLAALATGQNKALASQAELNENLKLRATEFDRQRLLFTADLSTFNQTVGQLSDQLQGEGARQTEQQAAIQSVLSRFTKDLDRFTESLNRAGENLLAERKALADLLEQTGAAEASAVADYRLLSTQITAAAMDMQDCNQKLAEVFQRTETDLSNSVQLFSEGMGATVTASLSDLEDALGKISLHLATGAAAVENAVRDLERAVRLTEKD